VIMNNKDYSQDEYVQLMLKFQKGDPASFEKLMVKLYPRVLNFIFRYLGTKESAEDITQDVFIKVYNNAHSYSPKAKLTTWIFTIARNAALNEIRRTKREVFSIDADIKGVDGDRQRQFKDEKAISPDKEILKKERSAIIKKAIDDLPENQRMAVLLRRFEGMSYEEIAQTMDTTEKAVKSLLNRAKESLKIKLSSLIE